MTPAMVDAPAVYPDHRVVEVRRVIHDVPGVRAVYASSASRVVEIDLDAACTSAGFLERRLDGA